MSDRIPPTSDLGFKKTFASESNKDVLQGIIGDFFDLRPELDDITITAPYDIKAYEEYLKHVGDGSKETREKLRQTVQDVTADISIAGLGMEVQIKPDGYFTERSLHYACTRFCSNYSLPGKMVFRYDGVPIRYSSLKPVYALNILGYPHFPGDDDALRVFTLYDRKRQKAFELEYLTLAYFELTKNNVETLNQHYWWTYFKTGDAPEGAPEYIKKAAYVIEKANMTKEERNVVDQMQRMQDIYDSTIYTAQIEGEKIGEARGEARGRIEGEARGKYEERFTIARKMLSRSRPMNEIAEDTGLTIDEIRKLLH